MYVPTFDCCVLVLVLMLMLMLVLVPVMMLMLVPLMLVLLFLCSTRAVGSLVRGLVTFVDVSDGLVQNFC